MAFFSKFTERAHRALLNAQKEAAAVARLGHLVGRRLLAERHRARLRVRAQLAHDPRHLRRVECIAALRRVELATHGAAHRGAPPVECDGESAGGDDELVLPQHGGALDCPAARWGRDRRCGRGQGVWSGDRWRGCCRLGYGRCFAAEPTGCDFRAAIYVAAQGQHDEQDEYPQ